MSSAQNGDKVKVNYVGKLTDGTVFDSSEGRAPLEFTLGEGMVIKGFEDAVADMSEGQSKEVTIPAEEAYGERREDLIVPVAREQFPDNLELKIGGTLQVKLQDGRTAQAGIAEIKEDQVTLDMNHPLAGKDLSFTIELAEVDKPSQ